MQTTLQLFFKQICCHILRENFISYELAFEHEFTFWCKPTLGFLLDLIFSIVSQGQTQAEKSRVSFVRQQLRQAKADKDALINEILDWKKKERIFELHK